MERLTRIITALLGIAFISAVMVGMASPDSLALSLRANSDMPFINNEGEDVRMSNLPGRIAEIQHKLEVTDTEPLLSDTPVANASCGTIDGWA